MELVCVVVVRVAHQIMLLAFVLGYVRPRLGLQLVLLSRQPLHEQRGMMDAASPPQEVFGRDGIRGEAVHAEIPIAGRGHGHLLEGVEGRARFDVTKEDHPSFSSLTSERLYAFNSFKAFARRMRLKYIFHGQNKSIHPFYVKSNWEPPVQP